MSAMAARPFVHTLYVSLKGGVFAADSPYVGWLVPAIGHAIVIAIINKLYSTVALKCTDLENHEYVKAHTSHDDTCMRITCTHYMVHACTHPCTHAYTQMHTLCIYTHAFMHACFHASHCVHMHTCTPINQMFLLF